MWRKQWICIHFFEKQNEICKNIWQNFVVSKNENIFFDVIIIFFLHFDIFFHNFSIFLSAQIKLKVASQPQGGAGGSISVGQRLNNAASGGQGGYCFLKKDWFLDGKWAFLNWFVRFFHFINIILIFVDAVKRRAVCVWWKSVTNILLLVVFFLTACYRVMSY